MSKINNVRLPNAAPIQYSPEQFNQLVRSLEQIVLQLNSTYTSTTDQDAIGQLAWYGDGQGIPEGTLFDKLEFIKTVPEIVS